MRTIGPFVDGYSLFWAVEGRGRKSATCDLRTPEGQDLFRRLAATRRRGVRELPPRHPGGLGPGPRRPRPPPGVRAHQRLRPGRPLRAPPRARPLGRGLRRPAPPDRRSRPAPVRPGVTVADYLTGVFAAEAALAALYRRGRRRPLGPNRGRGAVIDASLYGSVLRITGMDHPRLRPPRDGPQPRRATASSTPPPSTTTPRRTGARLRGGRGRRQLRPPVRGHGPDRPRRRPPLRHPGRPGPPRRHHQRHRGRSGPRHRTPPRWRRRASPTTCPWPRPTRPSTSRWTPTSPPATTWSPSTTPSSAPCASRPPTRGWWASRRRSPTGPRLWAPTTRGLVRPGRPVGDGARRARSQRDRVTPPHRHVEQGARMRTDDQHETRRGSRP